MNKDKQIVDQLEDAYYDSLYQQQNEDRWESQAIKDKTDYELSSVVDIEEPKQIIKSILI